MFVIGDTVVSDDLAQKQFVCDLTRCKGACCVEGDLGAPLQADELAIITDMATKVRPYMSAAGKAAVDAQGPYIKDYEGDYSTPTVDGKECAYAYYEATGVLKCAFEQAWQAGETSWPKPMSCHLYPVRLAEYDHYTAVNYEHWHICSPACELGASMQVPVYKFLQVPLTRKFGEGWYTELERQVAEQASW